MPIDEGQRFVVNQIRTVLHLLGRNSVTEGAVTWHHVFERNPLFAAVQKRRIVVVRVMLIEVSEELVESLLRRHAGRTFVANAPLAEQSRRVSGILQHLGDRQVFRAEIEFGIASDQAMAGMQPGHQCAATRSAHRRSRIKLRELHPLGGEPIDVRRPKVGLAVAGQIAISKIIREDEHDVRPTCISGT